MHRIRAAIALLGLVALGAVLYAALRTRTATLQWDYDYEKDPPCKDSATTPADKRCVVGFKVFLNTPTGRSEPQFVPNRFDQNGQIIRNGITCTMPVRRHGDMQFCVVAVATAGSAGAVESAPFCVDRRLPRFGHSDR
jgi:hypothetical protein